MQFENSAPLEIYQQLRANAYSNIFVHKGLFKSRKFCSNNVSYYLYNDPNDVKMHSDSLSSFTSG